MKGSTVWTCVKAKTTNILVEVAVWEQVETVP